METGIEYFKGIALLKGDSHFGVWVKECGRLDHNDWLLSRVTKYCKPGSVVIDAGAYIGDMTIAFSRAVGQEGLVLAFEPNPMAYKCLVHNVEKEGNVHTFQIGLSDKKESLGLEISTNNYGMANLRGEGKIKCLPLDNYIQTIQNLSFIKCDVEGYELKFLQGAKEVIRKHKPVMLIEMNHATLSRNGVSYADIFRWLDSEGYKTRNVNENEGLTEVQYDLLCEPE